MSREKTIQKALIITLVKVELTKAKNPKRVVTVMSPASCQAWLL